MITRMDCTPKSQYVISQNIVTSMRNPNMIDLKGMLELLHTNKDVNIQVKLFSTLSAYLMSNEADIDIIITHNSIYDKVSEILSHCPPTKATVMFNFLSALLYAEDEGVRRNNLVVYAKNMLRSSGCLATMCELFTSSMMHQDAWRSLCRCLAESCQGIEANQSYCTHLVPLCVQRCSQRNIEVFLVLQSLLQNHARNASLFVESNGISLFQREYLQHDVCLQVLNTLVQSSASAVELVNKTDVGQHLHDFLQLYGPQSQLGQWATIILYHISGATEGREMCTIKKHTITNKIIDKSVTLPRTSDSTRFIQNVMKEIQLCAPSDLKYLQGLFPADMLSEKTGAWKQQALIQNKLQSQVLPQKLNITPSFNNYNFQNKRSFVVNKNDLIQNECRRKNKMELSFSFLQKQCNERSSNVTMTAHKITESFQTFATYSNKTGTVSDSLARENIYRQRTPDLSNFEPKFASTPKRCDLLVPNKTIKQYRTNHRTSMLNPVTKHEAKRQFRKQKIASRSVRTPKRLEQTTIVKENKRRSVSGWFFGAVNESCTNLFKTVKNIFKPKKCQEETKTKSSRSMSVKDGSCSYSFTNYMRKRDDLLKSETKTSNSNRNEFSEFSMELTDSCNTCNDTMALKQKLDNDDHLKRTVRKLKLGINLYGCDFKKISKQLWPQQTYMTPVVLYNLYRKLIIK